MVYSWATAASSIGHSRLPLGPCQACSTIPVALQASLLTNSLVTHFTGRLGPTCRWRSCVTSIAYTLSTRRVACASSSNSDARGAASQYEGDDRASTGSKAGPSSTSNSTVPRKGPKQRYRLDEYCVTLYPQYSRNLIQSWILQGKVRVDDKIITKAGTPVLQGADVELLAEEPKYVCRAGLKLEKALKHFNIDVRGLTALDSGQSTGGFTDCLLQHGASKVYGIDVGYNQLADKVRRDERVVVIERFNLRYLAPQDLPCQVDIATLDLSFISVLKVVGAVAGVMKPSGSQLVVLIKPQFEAGREQVSAGGVVRDPEVHRQVIERVTGGIRELGFELRGVTESPIKGDKSGNTEFLAHFVRTGAAAAPARAADPSTEALVPEP